MNGTTQDVKRILVVDDNPVILRALSLALGARDYEVFTASDPSEALGFARLEKIDLILLDIFFPPDVDQNGMAWNAFRMIEWMQRTGMAQGVPIIIISGAEPKELRHRCLAAGAAAFFSKPLHLPDLLATIRQFLEPDEELVEPESDLVIPPPLQPDAPLMRDIAG